MPHKLPAVSVRYPVRLRLESWELPEGTVPESRPHDIAAKRLVDILEAWIVRDNKNACVARNLAIRWNRELPRIGIDPDVCIIEPEPPHSNSLQSLRLWDPEHNSPTICFEIVSETHPYKDYASIQDRYAAVGMRELVVFDPQLAGPATLGGPVLLQLWKLQPEGLLERIHFGDEPVYSEVLRAWLLPSTTTLEIASDREGTRAWLSAADEARMRAERERAEKEHLHSENERERAEKERALASEARERMAREELERRVRALEAKFGKA